MGAVLAVLLAALAAVQYQWSTRVAAADAQREKEHLDSAASLFANEFNAMIGQASGFVQNNARAALESGERLAAVPKVIGGLYYVEVASQGNPRVRRLTADGLFSPAPAPEWIAARGCTGFAVERPPALVLPLYAIATTQKTGAAGTLIRRTFRWQHDRCFIAQLDLAYLRGTLFPDLIRRSFGATATGEYSFAVVAPGRGGEALYGSPTRADLTKPFFSLSGPVTIPRPPSPADPPRQTVLIQRVETDSGEGRLANLFGHGIWELQIAHQGVPLAAAFERNRRLDLLLSLAVELLLAAAIILLVTGARRVERLADQKMRFVAGVSHELRSPVSAISMLSRNQADGLVTAPDRVRQYGELIHQQSRRLNEMVEQVLAYSGIHSGLRRPAKGDVDLGRLIRDAVDARREALDSGGFQVAIAVSPDLPRVSGDAALLRVALDNLLSNAQKYADGGRWIRVSADYLAPEKEVRISVEDRGAGIAAADQAEIFEPFYRCRAAIEAQIPGSGIGLSLVRGAAEAHGGRVTVASEPGAGSTFTMHLPL